MSEKIKPILKNLLKTRENYSETKKGATQIRVNLDTIESKMDEGIDNLTKTIAVDFQIKVGHLHMSHLSNYV